MVAPDRASHLPDRDRLILVGLSVLALAVMAMAAWTILGATVHFWGDQPTGRENALAARSAWVIAWAFFTPFFAWSMLRGRTEAIWAAGLWVLLFLFCTPWWWPPAPSDAFDAIQDPVWYGGMSVLPWTLLAAGLGTGILATWRSGQQALFIGALIVSIGIATVGGVSYLNLRQHAQDEQPEVTAEADAELTALAADPLWAALPAVERSDETEIPSFTDHDGTELPSMKMMTLGSVGDITLFRQVVSAAGSAGWTLHRSFCTDTTIEGTFTKDLSAGSATLRLTMASYISGVRVHASVSPASGVAEPIRCWEDLSG